jgi:Zn-dependent M28 family amino/carboxypeptidase
MLPGKSKPNEVIVFSAHYDHISEDMYNNYGRVFNGANDNASGTTAVLALADYFSMRNDNERTILFCLFAGEELGLLGSRAFVSTIKPESIKAVINIEMIGMTNAVGKNAFMVTGPDRSTLFDILKKNVRGIDINVKPLRRDDRNLFERSDNYPFYLKNIPAHTIMCSDDNDNCYHQACDDADRIDTKNMTSIIRAIAKSAVTLINGNDTPVIK